MLLRYLPLVTGLLPIVAIHVSLLMAVGSDTIPACFPYIDGCVSISATGRYVPASFVFKPAMIAESVLLVFYWLYSAAWLRLLPGNNRRFSNVIGWCGCIGALFLIVYVTFLGTQEPFYEFMRRFGVYVYFALTIIAQLAMALRLRSLATASELASIKTIVDWQLFLALVPFVLGILNLVLKATLTDPDAAENIIEWIFALLMQIYFVLTWLAWRRMDFEASVSIGRA